MKQCRVKVSERNQRTWVYGAFAKTCFHSSQVHETSLASLEKTLFGKVQGWVGTWLRSHLTSQQPPSSQQQQWKLAQTTDQPNDQPTNPSSSQTGSQSVETAYICTHTWTEHWSIWIAFTWFMIPMFCFQVKATACEKKGGTKQNSTMFEHHILHVKGVVQVHMTDQVMIPLPRHSFVALGLPRQAQCPCSENANTNARLHNNKRERGWNPCSAQMANVGG